MPPRHCRQTIQAAQNGRNASSEGLHIAIRAQQNPNASHQASRLRRSSLMASRKTALNRKVARLVSQAKRMAQYIEYGRNVHIHADHSATAPPKISSPIKNMVTDVSAEKTLFTASATQAAALE